jgi:hypothetical protein
LAIIFRGIIKKKLFTVTRLTTPCKDLNITF